MQKLMSLKAEVNQIGGMIDEVNNSSGSSKLIEIANNL